MPPVRRQLPPARRGHSGRPQSAQNFLQPLRLQVPRSFGKQEIEYPWTSFSPPTSLQPHPAADQFQIRGLLKISVGISALSLTQKIGNQLELPYPSSWRIVRCATTLYLGHSSRTVTCPTQAAQQRPSSLSGQSMSGPLFYVSRRTEEIICLRVAFRTER